MSRHHLMLLMVFLAVAALTPCWGQVDPGTAEVTIRGIMAFPGDEVLLPFYLSGSPSQRLNTLELQIQFPARLLEFVGLEEGFLLEESGVEVTSEVSKTMDQEEGLGALKIRLSGPDGIPEGLLARLKLKIDQTAPHGTTIPLTNRAEATAGRQGEAGEVPVRFPDSRIALSSQRREGEQPIFSCFFYMH